MKNESIFLGIKNETKIDPDSHKIILNDEYDRSISRNHALIYIENRRVFFFFYFHEKSCF